jgi:hypothetical protein
MDGWIHSIPTTGLRTWQNGARPLTLEDRLKAKHGYVALMTCIAGF